MTAAPGTAPNPLQLQGANFLNLLVVDDERSVRDVCREVAQSLGFNTSVAESAENDYRQLDAQSIDVVLLDLKLPGVGGLEALHEIKERRSLRIPALRERRQDIPLLAGFFLDRLSRTSGQERTISEEALKILLAYDWPGNVRELENCLERACAFTSNAIIQVRNLPSDIHGTHNLVVGGNGSAKIVPIEQLEKQTILNTIERLNGDKLQAARLLGIGKTTLYRKLKEYAAQG